MLHGSCGWSTSPTNCNLLKWDGKPDRPVSCYKNSFVGYCKKGSNCGGMFTDAQMEAGSGQRGGACNFDAGKKSCGGDTCLPTGHTA